ncbi:hypothetical protein [Arcticibacterium luteifluviistationis]|uniref:Uncharacterized protein n=1 Tax=Arcticibacterium luteifluviistationis TaxID=1784714 RepID=A0A2Z4GF64_9BACT|nr:hypothetical protein [Arcticibacterium luteifluviistationis]AWV99946.1 hypothetical protein DJ013_17930 [Arcticibacterium luteifluviistationis]
MKKFTIFFSFLTILCSCASKDAELTEQIYKNLKSKEAHVIIKINNELFYSPESTFQGNINLSSQFSDIGIIDQFGGNIQLQMSKNNWLQSERRVFQISPNSTMEYPNFGKMLIGKRDGDKLEGYILSRGNFEWIVLKKERAILSLEGYLVRPQDALMPENEIPFKGKIYFNEPNIDLNDLELSDL